VAPLTEIVELANAHGARTIVDEAHATGVLGPDGRGAVARAGLEGEVDVIVGTLGKALGSYGAYVCADSQTVRYMINTARSLIFSTAPPPPAIAGALAALELLRECPQRVRRLRSNARILRRALAREGFPVDEEGLHIVPLVVGDERAATRLCQEAIDRGVFAQAIRPPTVPSGTSRLRLAAMASHSASELQMAARVLREAASAIGLHPAEIGPPLVERHQSDVEAPVPDVEPFIPGLESDVAAAELDAELDTGRERLAAAAHSRRSGVPFDGERVTEGSEAPVPAGAGGSRLADGSHAPFDIERETAVPRAA
jgi:hypothetical protein